MRGRVLRFRALLRIEIHGQRTPGEVLLIRRQTDAIKAMPGTFGCLKQDCAVRDRRNRSWWFGAFFPGIAMQLQTSTPVLPPDRIKKHDQIQAAMRESSWMIVKIDMEIEILSI